MPKKNLPVFQSYLKKNSLVPDHQITFYAGWVNSFLSFCNHSEPAEPDLLIENFINQLVKQQKFQDWQISQARDAVGLYLMNFLSGDMSRLFPNHTILSKPPENNYKSLEHLMRKALRTKHYSYSTERTYIDWINRFYRYLSESSQEHRSTAKADADDVRNFLSYLAVQKRVSASTQNQAFNALLFLFREVLKVDLKDLNKTVRAKRGPKLPVVLTPDEVTAVLRQASGKNLMIVQLLYGTGMRLMEMVRLRVQDVDFSLSLIFVRSGKGDKDRTTMLPETVKSSLAAHLEEVKQIHEKDLAKGLGKVYMPDALDRKYPGAEKKWSWQYVFPSARLSVDPRTGTVRRHHISPATVQKIVAGAVRKSGIPKHATVHTLRHSFATHLMMNGVNIREVQELLGHKHVETTMVYTHVLRTLSNAPVSPLDMLQQGAQNT